MNNRVTKCDFCYHFQEGRCRSGGCCPGSAIEAYTKYMMSMTRNSHVTNKKVNINKKVTYKKRKKY